MQLTGQVYDKLGISFLKYNTHNNGPFSGRRGARSRGPICPPGYLKRLIDLLLKRHVPL